MNGTSNPPRFRKLSLEPDNANLYAAYSTACPRVSAKRKRRNALSLCFFAIPDAKPLHTFAGIAFVSGSATAEPLQLRPASEVLSAAQLSAIGRVHQGTGSHCTGVLIERDLAVTAAHCLYNRRTERWLEPSSIHFLLGYDRGEYEFHSIVADYERGSFDPQRPSQDLAADWALLRLSKPAPADFTPLPLAQNGLPSQRGFHVAGFATPRRYVVSVSPECTIADHGSLIMSPCPAALGMSGGPLIDAASGHLLGIQTAMITTGEDQRLMLAIPARNWQGSRK